MGRMLPIVRTFIAFPAGVAKMNQLKFHMYTFVGSWPWCYALAYIGMKLGDMVPTDPRLKEAFHRFPSGSGSGAGGGICVVRGVALEEPDPDREAA